MRQMRDVAPEVARRCEAAWAAAQGVLSAVAPRDRDLFAARLARSFPDLDAGLRAVYGHRDDFEAFVERVVVALAEQAVARPEPLRLLDLERDLTPDWLQRESMLGYVFYVDRFAGDLRGVREHLDYLVDLGVTYAHLMSVIRPREGESDGGFAVADYRDVDPRLGSWDDFVATCSALRERGIAPCVDLVLNHCADTHPWAVAARSGDARAAALFHTFPDRTLPDAFEATLPEVFPDFAPGNFTFSPAMNQWVWTTFHAYQWDLNWSNPEVFLEIAGIMGHLANAGVQVLRLDAVAFMWKRLGTDCQNQPEVFDLMRALRACSRIATPAVAHKAEAIVAPRQLVKYVGRGEHHGRLADMAYHNVLMVQIWSALATRDARLLTHTLRAYPSAPATIAWATYVRCHDDIGWAIDDDDAAAVGWSGPAHRAFLSDFYAGVFPGSFARGEVFQANPATGDRRISGACASLAGLERALEVGDPAAVEQALARIVLAHAVIASFGGVPLLYMGDELGAMNDPSFAASPDLRADNRWLHRPRMDWSRAERRYDPATIEGRLFAAVRGVLRTRAGIRALHAATPMVVEGALPGSVFGWWRHHPTGSLLALFNVADVPVAVDAALVRRLGADRVVDRLSGRALDASGAAVVLEPLRAVWLSVASHG
jgi:amylosucrase